MENVPLQTDSLILFNLLSKPMWPWIVFLESRMIHQFILMLKLLKMVNSYCMKETVKSTLLQVHFFNLDFSWNQICSNWFHVNHLHNLNTVWLIQKFTLSLFWQKFRESNVFTKELISRIFCQKNVRVKTLCNSDFT